MRIGSSGGSSDDDKKAFVWNDGYGIVEGFDDDTGGTSTGRSEGDFENVWGFAPADCEKSNTGGVQRRSMKTLPTAPIKASSLSGIPQTRASATSRTGSSSFHVAESQTSNCDMYRPSSAFPGIPLKAEVNATTEAAEKVDKEKESGKSKGGKNSTPFPGIPLKEGNADSKGRSGSQRVGVRPASSRTFNAPRPPMARPNTLVFSKTEPFPGVRVRDSDFNLASSVAGGTSSLTIHPDNVTPISRSSSTTGVGNEPVTKKSRGSRSSTVGSSVSLVRKSRADQDQSKKKSRRGSVHDLEEIDLPSGAEEHIDCSSPFPGIPLKGQTSPPTSPQCEDTSTSPTGQEEEVSVSVSSPFPGIRLKSDLDPFPGVPLKVNGEPLSPRTAGDGSLLLAKPSSSTSTKRNRGSARVNNLLSGKESGGGAQIEKDARKLSKKEGRDINNDVAPFPGVSLHTASPPGGLASTCSSSHEDAPSSASAFPGIPLRSSSFNTDTSKGGTGVEGQSGESGWASSSADNRRERSTTVLLRSSVQITQHEDLRLEIEAMEGKVPSRDKGAARARVQMPSSPKKEKKIGLEDSVLPGGKKTAWSESKPEGGDKHHHDVEEDAGSKVSFSPQLERRLGPTRESKTHEVIIGQEESECKTPPRDKEQDEEEES